MNIGLPGLMFLIFLTLKLIGYITWSWAWVTAPLWGGLLLWMIIVFAVIIAAAAQDLRNK